MALRVAERDGLLEPGANPCSGVRAPADHRIERAARILTPQEVSGILEAAAADDARLGRSFGAPLIALLFGTGLRPGEALALPWGPEGLDLEAGVVRVRRSLDRVRDKETGTFAFVAPKTRTSRREVPVRPSDVALLKRHRLASGRPRDGAQRSDLTRARGHSGANRGPRPASGVFPDFPCRPVTATRNPA